MTLIINFNYCDHNCITNTVCICILNAWYVVLHKHMHQTHSVTSNNFIKITLEPVYDHYECILIQEYRISSLSVQVCLEMIFDTYSLSSHRKSHSNYKSHNSWSWMRTAIYYSKRSPLSAYILINQHWREF